MARWLYPLAAIVLVAAAAFASVTFWRADGKTDAQRPGVRQQSQPAASGGVPVETSVARRAKTSTDLRAVGSLQSDESVKIAPELAGRVTEIAFREGDRVREGDILVRLDDALVRAEVADAEARHELARANLERARTLAQRGAGTERALDEATAAFATAGGALELAKVRLAKHTITAPFSGIVGLRSVSVGAFVSVGTEIVNLEKIDGLKIDFKVPEVFLADVATNQSVEVSVDALPGRIFTGTIYAIDPMVDVNGRALRIRARLPNPDGVLRPGLFARITVKGPSQENVVTVPESAVVPRGSESYVYRIEQGKAVETQVRLGGRKAGQVEVLEGLAPESVVVTAGHQRLRDGATVEVVSSDARART